MQNTDIHYVARIYNF